METVSITTLLSVSRGVSSTPLICFRTCGPSSRGLRGLTGESQIDGVRTSYSYWVGVAIDLLSGGPSLSSFSFQSLHTHKDLTNSVSFLLYSVPDLVDPRTPTNLTRISDETFLSLGDYFNSTSYRTKINIRPSQ